MYSVVSACGSEKSVQWSVRWSANVQCGQCGDGHQRSTCRTEAMTLERMTDGDVPFDGEAEYKQRTEVLRGEEYNRKQFAETRHLQKVKIPLGLQLV